MHDRQILAALLKDRMPLRFGWLVVKDTVRRLDVIDISKNNSPDQYTKKLYSNIFFIRVSSEMYLHEFVRRTLATSATVDLTVLQDGPSVRYEYELDAGALDGKA